MKCYKSIFRLDYPLSYSIVDGLGHRLQFLLDRSRDKPFLNVKGGISIGNNHSLDHYGQVGNDVFKTYLNPETFNSSIEHYNGIALSDLHNHKVIKLSNELISEKPIQDSNARYKRIGLRTWVIIDDKDLKRESILKYMCKSNKFVTDVIKDEFNAASDIATVIESQNESGAKIRIQLGPYDKSEMRKYFFLSQKSEVEVEEGLIIDFDFWEERLDVPGFDLSTYCRHKSKLISSICEKTVQSLKKEILV
jgi:hypothetical protein